MDTWLIDTRRLAERGERVERQLTTRDVPRLRKECSTPFAPVEVSVTGVRTSLGKPGVRVVMRAQVKVPCQRCLKPLPLELNLACAFEWVASESEQALRDADDEWDAVIAAEQVDLLPLLEDELLLALPFAPMHPGCQSGVASEADEEAGEKTSPFAALANLKRV